MIEQLLPFFCAQFWVAFNRIFHLGIGQLFCLPNASV